MVLKPSEVAPLSSIVFAEIVHAAGVPAGVFNMVNGDGMGVGTDLSTHPDVDMISFTGSARAGAAISKAAADTFKRVCLELGGKGANVVFADADEKAVERGVRHCFNNTGQSCNAPTRMLVERPVYEQAVETAVEVAASTKVAAPRRKATISARWSLPPSSTRSRATSRRVSMRARAWSPAALAARKASTGAISCVRPCLPMCPTT
jgi:acyl-CoA reductase-like NAD-dependent aldehyde dehydrogenase